MEDVLLDPTFWQTIAAALNGGAGEGMLSTVIGFLAGVATAKYRLPLAVLKAALAATRRKKPVKKPKQDSATEEVKKEVL